MVWRDLGLNPGLPDHWRTLYHSEFKSPTTIAGVTYMSLWSGRNKELESLRQSGVFSFILATPASTLMLFLFIHLPLNVEPITKTPTYSIIINKKGLVKSISRVVFLVPGRVRGNVSTVERTEGNRGQKWVSGCHITLYMASNRHINSLRVIIMYCIPTITHSLNRFFKICDKSPVYRAMMKEENT